MENMKIQTGHVMVNYLVILLFAIFMILFIFSVVSEPSLMYEKYTLGSL